MITDKQNYKNYAKNHMPSSKVLINAAKAMFFGGAVCVLGQFLREIYLDILKDEEMAGALCSVSLIFLSACLTSLGIFDKIARHAGAGLLVPITGFANSIVSAAIENKAEGWVMGLGAKIFIIAGPVILYGTLASVVYGLIYWFLNYFQLLGG